VDTQWIRRGWLRCSRVPLFQVRGRKSLTASSAITASAQRRTSSTRRSTTPSGVSALTLSALSATRAAARPKHGRRKGERSRLKDGRDPAEPPLVTYNQGALDRRDGRATGLLKNAGASSESRAAPRSPARPGARSRRRDCRRRATAPPSSPGDTGDSRVPHRVAVSRTKCAIWPAGTKSCTDGVHPQLIYIQGMKCLAHTQSCSRQLRTPASPYYPDGLPGKAGPFTALSLEGIDITGCSADRRERGVSGASAGQLPV
jgi:hypothetical protein